MTNMRRLITLCESIYDDEPDEEPSGSFGWWIFPDGSVHEMEEMGNHGVTANAWLSNNDSNYANDDFDEAIDKLISAGCVNPAKAGWKHRIVSRRWHDRQECDDCLIWIIKTHGTAAGGGGPSSGKVWDGQFLRMEDETISRIIFYTDKEEIMLAFMEKWSD